MIFLQTNKKDITTNNLVSIAFFIALGLVLPMIFHSFNMGGKIFLPMHIPVLLGGLILGPLAGLIIGILTPILSSVITGMPPVFPMLPLMIVELGTYGFISGYLRKNKDMSIFQSLIISMIVGRLMGGIMAFILGYFGFSEGPVTYLMNAVTNGLPGIIIQLIFIPIIAKRTEKFYENRLNS